jgi:DNA repair protein RadC
MNYPERVSIKSWAEDDRPREKLLLKGSAALSDAELVAILIGSGNRSMSAVELSQLILRESGNNLAELAKKSLSDLMTYKGIGEAKAISIVAALELGRRRKAEAKQERTRISSSKHAYEELSNLADLTHEQFWILILNRANEVMDKVQVSSGGVSGTVADARLIFKPAIQKLASGIVLAHNHPSGNLKPSQSDIDLTKKLREAGLLLDISIIDHLIVSDSGYYSFADEGLL